MKKFFEKIIKLINLSFLDWPKEERSRNVKLILREKLPVENYELFKYIVEFLVQVKFLLLINNFCMLMLIF